MSRIVLDAGALIALERDDRTLWGALKLAALRSRDVLVPTTALAQVWLSPPEFEGPTFTGITGTQGPTR